MPVTKTAKRALRSSQRKESVNKIISSRLEAAIRIAKKLKTVEKISKAASLADKAVKKGFLHKNKASRIKSALSKLSISKKTQTKKAPAKKK